MSLVLRADTAAMLGGEGRRTIHGGAGSFDDLDDGALRSGRIAVTFALPVGTGQTFRVTTSLVVGTEGQAPARGGEAVEVEGRVLVESGVETATVEARITNDMTKFYVSINAQASAPEGIAAATDRVDEEAAKASELGYDGDIESDDEVVSDSIDALLRSNVLTDVVRARFADEIIRILNDRDGFLYGERDIEVLKSLADALGTSPDLVLENYFECTNVNYRDLQALINYMRVFSDADLEYWQYEEFADLFVKFNMDISLFQAVMEGVIADHEDGSGLRGRLDRLLDEFESLALSEGDESYDDEMSFRCAGCTVEPESLSSGGGENYEDQMALRCAGCMKSDDD